MYSVGSVCSGIEAASIAWSSSGMRFNWFSEIASFPSKLLTYRYPEVSNIGDMRSVPRLIASEEIVAPDIICGGTPCQAFSVAGWQSGLEDDRANLTLSFVDIVEANDLKRAEKELPPSVIFWENVEGVLSDKTNAFGSLVSSLAGLDYALVHKKWPTAGIIRGPKRNVAWRVLDSKYFGVPQQRRRLYLIAGGNDYYPENVLFESFSSNVPVFPDYPLVFEENGVRFESFRAYTDCLYSSYGTKWNGNAAAYNGSLFLLQDGELRRLSPLECERLMGFPDAYTDLPGATRTARYQAIGNSWAVPVVRWIGKRIGLGSSIKGSILPSSLFAESRCGCNYVSLGSHEQCMNYQINASAWPNTPHYKSLKQIVDANASRKLYISPTGCYGIIRRKNERKLRINARLEKVLIEVSRTIAPEEIEKKSRVQKRGRFSDGRYEATQTLF